MNIPAGPEDARANAPGELALLQEQIGQAQARLAQLNTDIAQRQDRFGETGTLVDVNQRLVLATLRAQIDAEETRQSAHRDAEADHQLRHAQLSKANEQLVLAAIGAQELQAAAERAQRRQADLLALVAHELRHPLAPIRNAAAVLARIPEPPAVLVRMQSIIERQVRNMARLVGDLMDAAGAQTGKLRIQRERIDLVAVLEDAVEAFRPAMEARMQRFSCPPLPARLPMEGDMGRLAQVFGNLLDNASKYTPLGGDILLDVNVAADGVHVTVSDGGIGITAEALPGVFEPFVQDAHATVFNGVGLGLGLTVVRELVEAHDGTVTAHSDGPGLGSRFVVILPLVPNAHGAE